MAKTIYDNKVKKTEPGTAKPAPIEQNESGLMNKSIERKCPVGACGNTTELVVQEYGKMMIIHCLKCGYSAKFVEGKLV
jgi:hypothetical protein